MKFCHNTNVTLLKQSQRSRSVLQDGSRSLGLFWKEKSPSYNQRNTVVFEVHCRSKYQKHEIINKQDIRHNCLACFTWSPNQWKFSHSKRHVVRYLWPDPVYYISWLFPDLQITISASLLCDPVILVNPPGVIQQVWSSYICNNAYGIMMIHNNYTPPCFPLLIQRETTFFTSCLLLWLRRPIQNGDYFYKKKQFSAHEQSFNAYHREGRQKWNQRVSYPKSVLVFP